VSSTVIFIFTDRWTGQSCATAAIVSLFLIKVFAIDKLRGKISFFPLIKNSDVLAIAPWILIAAVVIAVIAGTIGMRRFLDV